MDDNRASATSSHFIFERDAKWRHPLTMEKVGCLKAMSLLTSQCYNDHADEFLSAVITGMMKFGATTFSHYQNGKVNTDSLPRKKFKTLHTTAGKVQLSSFFDRNGPLLIDLLKHGAMVKAVL